MIQWVNELMTKWAGLWFFCLLLAAAKSYPCYLYEMKNFDQHILEDLVHEKESLL